MKHTVHVAVVTHRHGISTIVACNSVQLYRKLADWCDEYKSELRLAVQPDFERAMEADDPSTAVKIYFREQEDEYLDVPNPDTYEDEYDPDAGPNGRWLDDGIQFMRLLAEIDAVGLTRRQLVDLALSMDLREDQLSELFDRAMAQWDAYKETIPKGA